MDIKFEQVNICEKYGAEFVEAPYFLLVGITKNVETRDLYPINGLRHPPEGETTGWYIWAGEEFSEDPDWFRPMHVAHLSDLKPEVLKYLALPPGYRFLIGENGYEDVWFDGKLLGI
ncbi:hypothetical protein [Chitinophaga sp. S165]|uniref:immunity protein Imm33 domain-containing protein n=1 Tax=Chitinophaga sp. S165 TaxID=2135462 RepID=UPI000D71D01A|nr:hypothetical protein [Chitinophaga sp. S165]